MRLQDATVLCLALTCMLGARSGHLDRPVDSAYIGTPVRSSRSNIPWWDEDDDGTQVRLSSTAWDACLGRCLVPPPGAGAAASASLSAIQVCMEQLMVVRARWCWCWR